MHSVKIIGLSKIICFYGIITLLTVHKIGPKAPYLYFEL